MIELALAGLLGGSLFQDHKWRVNEWSGWHPAFKYIGLWTGYTAEYIDIFLFLWLLTTNCILFQNCLHASIIITASYGLIAPLLLLHIYHPQVRWGWCYLHSAVLQLLWNKLEQLPNARVHLYIWLDNNNNTHNEGHTLPKINLLYIPTLATAIATADKNFFIEEALFTDDTAEWKLMWIPISLVCAVFQLNYLITCKPDIPDTQDINPVLRITKGYTLFQHHFLKWHFFRVHAMPWKFFHLMRLQGLYELNPHTRSWLAGYSDVAVLPRLNSTTRLTAANHTLDWRMWPTFKPMLQRGTYHSKTRCDSIYSTYD